MDFGEQVTKGGIIISDDDGTSRGIYPVGVKFMLKVPENDDPHNIGD